MSVYLLMRLKDVKLTSIHNPFLSDICSGSSCCNLVVAF